MYTFPLLALATLATATFHYNFYSDTSCGNFVQDFIGSNSNTDGTTKDVNGYIGSVLVVSEEDWTNQFDYSYNPSKCLYYDTPCARGAPDCINNSGGPGSCFALDMNVGTVWAGFTVCDVAGFDTDYKREINGSSEA